MTYLFSHPSIVSLNCLIDEEIFLPVADTLSKMKYLSSDCINEILHRSIEMTVCLLRMYELPV